MFGNQPVFAAGEYSRRSARMRELMRDRSLDALLLHSPEAIAWLTGYRSPAFFPYTALAIRPDEPPMLVFWSMEMATAHATAEAPDLVLRPYGHGISPTEALAQSCGAVLRGHVGIEGACWYLTAARLSALTAAFTGAAFVHVDRDIEFARAVKSEAEIGLIRAATIAAEAGMRAALEITRDGVTEREVAAAMAAARIRAGSDLPVDGTIVSGPRAAEAHGGWSDRVLRDGDLFHYGLHGIKHGYWGRLARAGVVGGVSDGRSKILDRMAKILDAAVHVARPGLRARELDASLREPMLASGIKTDRHGFRNRLGYGLGLHFRPSPGEFFLEITPEANYVLEAGMVLHLFLNHDGLAVSEAIVVRDAGAERLTTVRNILHGAC